MNEDLHEILYDGNVEPQILTSATAKRDMSAYAAALCKGLAGWKANSATDFQHFAELDHAVRSFNEPKAMSLAINKFNMEAPNTKNRKNLHQEASNASSNHKKSDFVCNVDDEL